MGQLSLVSPLFILSGDREIGKTSFLNHLLQDPALLNTDIAGVISPAVFQGQRKIGIDILDPRMRVQKRLATLRSAEETESVTLHWNFLQDAMNWGNQLLAASVPCDLLIVDELGPLELKLGEGWQQGIAAVSSGRYALCLLVIRPTLLEVAQTLWPTSEVFLFQSKNDPRWGNLYDRILSILR
jgi:nucleoside-triphosphatase THEP1